MEKAFEKRYHDVETKHWWFKSRRNYILELLKSHSRDSKILDIGCSSGLMIQEMMAAGFRPENIFGIDISEVAIENCHSKGIKNAFLMDAQEISLPEKFDVLIASDCLEHLPNDMKALQNWYSLLKSNGVLLVFVPAFMSLWSAHDEANMHLKRYTLPELKVLLQKQGFLLLKTSYWNFFLFLPVFVFRKMGNLFSKTTTVPEGDLKPTPALVNGALTILISFENWLLKTLNFPVGVSAFCIARKEKTKN